MKKQIKIINSSVSTYWYNNMINSIYTVVEKDEFNYMVVNKKVDNGVKHLILKVDCEDIFFRISDNIIQTPSQ